MLALGMIKKLFTFRAQGSEKLRIVNRTCGKLIECGDALKKKQEKK